MPPPNITGKLHMGHALFLTIQDSIHRFNQQAGHTSLWIPGLDHAGLATHDKIITYQQESGLSYEESAQWISSHHKEIILSQIQQLGALPDWKKLTYTLDESYKELAWDILRLLNEDKRIYIKDNQYYLNIKDLAAELKKEIDSQTIKIIPKTEIGALTHFLDNIEDWCISRQIPWGLSLPINSELTFDLEYQSEHTLDTWFNSSLWPLACLLKHPELIKDFYPAQLIETGADILFFWCAKMLMMGNYIFKNQDRLKNSIQLKNPYPFYTIYLHGLIRDKQNRKFSKSLGNGIDPLDLIKKYGADTTRLFIISRSGPAEDIKFNENDMPGIKKFMNKMWQSARFLSIYANQAQMEKIKDLNTIHHPKLEELQEKFCSEMEQYHFLEASRLIHSEFKQWFCDQWIEDNKLKIQALDIPTIKEGIHILEQLLAMIAIFCPFIATEIKKEFYQ